MKKFNSFMAIVFCAWLVSSCGKVSAQSPLEFQGRQTDWVGSAFEMFKDDPIEFDLEAFLDQAEQKATPQGLVLLQISRAMIKAGERVTGSCWDYINEIYNRAHVTGKNRATTFRSPQAGPFADVALIQPGDWLYFINHSYGDIEHSSIFVDWIDFDKKEALMISYAGGNRQDPARYKSYDLSSVYTIIRSK